MGGQHEFAVDAADTAATLFERIGDRRAAARARVSSGTDKGMLGRRLESVREMAVACEVLRETPDR